MTQPFAFPPPPPPPPPPKRDDNPGHVSRGQNGYSNLQRGRAGYGGAHQGSRAGGLVSRGNSSSNFRGSHNYPRNHQTVSTYNAAALDKSPAIKFQNSVHQATSTSSDIISQKRSHSTAFHSSTHSTGSRNRPLAPPAIPSFSLDLENLLPKRLPTALATSSDKQKRANVLGLTPSTDVNNSSDEDDEDEELRLGSANNTGSHNIEFVYRGQTSLLRTPEEVAAWISERRKKYPTLERVEQAKEEAAEKRRKWEAEKQARYEAAREAARIKQEERLQLNLEREKARLRERMLADHVKRVRLAEKEPQGEGGRAEKLRIKAQRAAQKLVKAQDALRSAEAAAQMMSNSNQAELNDHSQLDTLLAEVDNAAHNQNNQPATPSSPADATHLVQIEADEDDTSSSGSSTEDSSDTNSNVDDDSDSAPEIASSRRVGPEQVSPPPRTKPTSQVLCRNFSKYGRCRNGPRCRFLHEKPDKKKNISISMTAKRKRLFQVMVEKEVEEERRKIMYAIVTLGEKGAFEEDGTADQQRPS